MSRPYVLLSVAASVDGYIDDASPHRLLLSSAEDFDRVDQVRAESDAILVGAQTLRSDNPRLLVNDEARRAERLAAGKPEFPLKVTVTASGDLDPELRFWQYGGDKLVYTTIAGAARLGNRLGESAEVVALGDRIELGRLLDDLGDRGIGRLMVEGGTRILTGFLAADLADELLLAIAPLIVGDAGAPRVLEPADFPGGARRRMRLAEVGRAGDVAVLRYLPKTGDLPEASPRRPS
ncbi:RibD family protein [Nocardia cyriacigeorgica]|uniref:RibD family protein n=1 Tax=Nocardia cyriacigeorgica TaxID=135487 RepID=UPI0018950CC9|nr:dihydrofolate reductase family protein [Nocardia cyriacigeorgica]MBF6413075.1 dihydrofolate reductase family protein [Nocardia cyriacigeorgica]